MLRDFENEAVALVLGLERVQNLRADAPSNCTSTTAPITWRTLPTLLAIFLSSQYVQAIDSVTGTLPRVAFE